MQRRARWRGGLIKGVVGAVLLGLLLWKVDWSELWQQARRINAWYVPPLLGVSLVLMGVSCWKWWILLRSRGVTAGFWRLMELYTMGYFFNTFMPSNVGGDVMRGWLFGRDIGSKVESYASVFMQRFTGLAALVAVSLAAVLLMGRTVLARPVLLVCIVAVYVGFTALLMLILSVRVRRWLGGTFGGRAGRVVGQLRQFHDALLSFRSKPRTVAQALAISLSFHLLTSVNALLAGWAFGIDVPVLGVFVVVPLVLLVSMLPISINAYGVWEFSFGYLYQQLGAPFEAGLAVAFLLRAKNIAFAILGGVLFMLWRRQQPETERLGAVANPSRETNPREAESEEGAA